MMKAFKRTSIYFFYKIPFVGKPLGTYADAMMDLSFSVVYRKSYSVYLIGLKTGQPLAAVAIHPIEL